jgi:hypothetical protein
MKTRERRRPPPATLPGNQWHPPVTERVATPFEHERRALAAGPLAPRPLLGLIDELAQFLEKGCHGGAHALQPLDAVESCEHGARFVHRFEASAAPHTEMQRLGDESVRRAAV